MVGNSGYTYLPNGVLIQWGGAYISTQDGTLDTTFPISFPKACWVMVAVATGTKGKDSKECLNAVTVYSVSRTRYNITHWSYPRTYDWIAIGY